VFTENLIRIPADGIFRKGQGPPSQGHAPDIAAMDLFVADYYFVIRSMRSSSLA